MPCVAVRCNVLQCCRVLQYFEKKCCLLESKWKIKYDLLQLQYFALSDFTKKVERH